MKPKVKTKSKLKPTAKETAERLEQVARMHYIDGQSLGEVAEALGIKSTSTVSRLRDDAVRLGVVSFNVDKSYAFIGFEDNPLTSRLRDDFNLGDSTVVMRIDAERTSDSHEEDDHVHLALANQAGVKIRERLSSDQYVAVAGGRAVVRAIQSFSRIPPARRRVRITPLSGRTWSHSWRSDGKILERPLDSDNAAYLFAQALEKEEGTSFDQIAMPVFADSAKAAQEIINVYCLFKNDGSWKDRIPDLGIVGVGCLDPNGGHRFTDFLTKSQKYTQQDPQDPHTKHLRSLATELEDIHNIVQNFKDAAEPEITLPYCGDVANRVFCSLPLPEALLGKEGVEDEARIHNRLSLYTRSYNNLMQPVGKLNAKLIGMQWRHLQQVRTVVALAGGQYKRNCLWTLLLLNRLLPEQRIITDLITDAECAKVLRDAIRQYKSAPGYVKEWYKDWVKKNFSNEETLPVRKKHTR